MALPDSGYGTSIYQAPTGDITDFTLMSNSENYYADYWTDVNSADGTRGRFAKDTSPTEIPFDFIDFDDAGESGWARLFIGNSFAADSEATRTIRAYSPNTRNVAYGPSDTYGSDNAYDSDWVGYWPLFADATDRTSNGNDLVPVNSPTFGTTAKVGDGVTFNGSNQYIVTLSALLTSYPFTMMSWFNADDATGAHTIMSLGSSTNGDQYWHVDARGDVGGDPIRVVSRNVSQSAVSSTAGFSASTWHHSAGVFTSNISRTVYLDAANSATSTDNSTPTNINRTALGVNISVAGDFLTGILNDAQLHSVARSTNWLSEEYSQTNDNGAFWGTWNWTGVVGVTLDAESGTFALTGQAATLLKTSLLTVDPGAFSLTGQNADLLKGSLLIAEPGSYILSGQEASLLKGSKIIIDIGSFSLTGQNIDLRKGRTVLAEAGAFALTGQEINILKTNILNTESGTFVFTGSAADLLKGFYLSAESAVYSLTGFDATLTYDEGDPSINVESGSFILTGQDITLTYVPLLKADGTLCVIITAHPISLSFNAKPIKISMDAKPITVGITGGRICQ